MFMATAKTVAGVLGAIGLTAGIAVTTLTGPAPVAKKSAPQDAKHLWARQPDGGTLLRDPLPTLDDGGCQLWAQRCSDKKCKAVCE